jgi:very-short-patch-repair endonuclease
MRGDALEKARRLRRDETKAEQAAWNLLRNRQRLGHKFRRQQPVGKRIVDFCCLELRLIIELDGSVHAQPSQTLRDERRDHELRAQGFRVLHFSNGLVLANPQGFVAKVEAAITANPPLTPFPSPARGEGSRVCEEVGWK